MAPTRKIRVLVVDDAVAVRRLIGDALAADPELEVVGTAANGRIALTKVQTLAPDLVTLDIEMPELDGLGALRELRKLKPRLPVIMFSSLTQRGAVVTVEALTLGANDYVTKPESAAALTQTMGELIAKIKALCPRRDEPAPPPLATVAPLPAPLRPLTPLKPAASPGAVELIAIGCSAGGPNALALLLPRLSASLPVPIVIVQHMPTVFTRLLAERLDEACAIDVREGAAGMELRAGVAHVAPGGLHMRVQRGTPPTLLLDQGAPEHSCRPAVDVLFASAAAAYGAGVLGVVLTGMGQDGLRGSELIRAAGGDVLVQDQASSVVWGMPGLVAQRGLASAVLPLDELADAITRRVARDAPAARLAQGRAR